MKHLFSLALALLLTNPAVRAQQPATTPSAAEPGELNCRVLTGRVTDMLAYPLTGATVMLRSKAKGFSADAFSTNAEGQFMVTSKQPIPQNTVLEITAAGYTSFEQPLANCQALDISLEPLPGTRFKSDGRIKKTRITGKIH